MEEWHSRIDKYYDIQCGICGFNRGTDFEFGMEHLR